MQITTLAREYVLLCALAITLFKVLSKRLGQTLMVTPWTVMEITTLKGANLIA